MTAPARTAALLAALIAACTGLTGCGLPHPGTVEKIDDAKVPYHLLDDGPVGSPTKTRRVHASQTEPRVYWVARSALAAAATDQSCAGDTYTVIQKLLRTLAAGPTATERATGLTTALTPDSGVALLELSGRTAVVELQPSTPLPPDRLPQAIGQVVLTVTSAPGVGRVVLRNDGQRLQVPLPGGALTASPVSAQDYDSLVRPRDRNYSGAGCARAAR